MSPLLSIVVATRNRVPYCISLIKSILSIDDHRLQLIIQDNSDSRELTDYIRNEVSDTRLKYRYTAPPFSSIQNFNAALDLAEGEYVCMIGDDDGVNPEIIEVANWASKNNIDAVSGNYLVANYRWDNTGAPNTFFTNMDGDALTVLSFSGKIKQPDIERNLRRLMRNGCTNHLNFDLPKLYHGIVKFSCLAKIKENSGEYIKGLSPDVYSALSLSCVVNRLVVFDYPLTIPGACGVSSSINEGQKRGHSKQLKNAPHFRNRGNYIWSNEVPRLYSAQTIWSDSGFAALREMNRKDLIAMFNKYQLYANIIYSDRSSFTLLLSHLKEARSGRFLLIISDCVRIIFAIISGPFIIVFIPKLIRRLSIIFKLKKIAVYTNLDGMIKVMHTLQSHVKSTGIKISDLLFDDIPESMGKH